MQGRWLEGAAGDSPAAQQLGVGRVLVPLMWPFTVEGLEGAAGSHQGKGTRLQIQVLCSLRAVGVYLPPPSLRIARSQLHFKLKAIQTSHSELASGLAWNMV